MTSLVRQSPGSLAWCAVCVAACVQYEACGETPRVTVEKTSDSIVDGSALNMAEGRYGTCINGQTFQQEALTSLNACQYAAYFAHGGVLCLARRRLPDGDWEVIRFDDYAIRHNDVHNVAVVGICPADGTIHLSFDHHSSTLHYRCSVPGLASRPGDFRWEPRLFNKTTSSLQRGKPIQSVTYPQFFSTPEGRLQLAFRIGGSGNGDWHLAEYDPDAGGWQILGMLFSRKGLFESSTSRSAYPNQFRYDHRCRLHVTWCWRERPRGGPYDLTTNHDLHYAYSDDFGRTWKNSAGETVAVLAQGAGSGARVIALDSPGIRVRQTRFLWGQMNTTTQFVDDRGRVHVIHWQNPHDATQGTLNMNEWRYYHYWRDTDGQWHENRLPFVGRKPQILLDRSGNAYVVFCKGEDLNYHNRDPGGHLCIATATEASQWTDWQIVHREERRSVGEPLFDPQRWQREQVLSVYTQEEPASAGTPSALHVVDFRPTGATRR